MTTTVDIANRAFQLIGTRTTIASLGESSNEAIQANLIINQLRDDILRMAPWNAATNTAALTLITATPGTPENTTTGVTQWSKGLPPPPWAYEYQYPVDCLRPLYIVPQFNTGFASGVPITTAITGGAPSYWNGPPVRFKVGIDQFLPVLSAAVAAGGSGYAVGDTINLAAGPVTSSPIGGPASLTVATVAGSAVAAASVVNQIAGEAVPQGGSYFSAQTTPQAQGSTSGAGTGATFNLTFGPAKLDQRVILTNQELAILVYMKQVADPNVMDPLLIDAWVNALAARLCFALTGDKALSNLKLAEANNMIMEARKADANEGLTINDVTPDFIRARGIYYTEWAWSPNMALDWGPLFTPY